jgi:hypothetical protein
MPNNTPMDIGGPQDLAGMMAQMMSQMNDMRAEQASEREAMRTQIRALQENVASLQTTPTNTPQSPTPPPLPAFTVTPPSPPGRLKGKATLPDPPRFDGTRKKFRTWKQEMESKLETDGLAIGSKRDQFAYIFARLTDVPQAMSAAYYDHSKRTSATDPLGFLSYLSSCYLDPNLSQKALGRLGSMTQGDKETFASFLPRFEKELADADGAGWTAAVKISYLKRALNREMRGELKGQLNMPTEYHPYVRALQDLGANLDEFRGFSQRNSSWRSGQKGTQEQTEAPPQRGSPPGSPSPDAMDWEPTKISKAVQRQNKELAGKRAKWVDQEERARRRKEKRCLRCGRDGCWIEECPLLPARRPNPPTNTRVKKSQPKLPRIEDLVDMEDDLSDRTETDEEELKE